MENQREKDNFMTKDKMKGFRSEYIDIICLVILFLIFFVALFLTHGVWFVVDLLLLAGTGAVLGRTVGKIKSNYID